LLIPRLRIPFLWYCAAAFRYFIGSTRYKGLQFESDLTGGQYLKLDFVMWLYGLGLLILPVLLIVIPIAGLNLAGDGEIFQVFIQKANAHPGLYILTTVPITLTFLASNNQLRHSNRPVPDPTDNRVALSFHYGHGQHQFYRYPAIGPGSPNARRRVCRHA